MVSRFFGPGPGLVPSGDTFGALQREVNRVFDEVFRGFPAMGRGAAMMGGFAPNLDVHETDSGLEITAELPGMSEGDVDLRLEGDLITLSGEKKAETTRESGGTHLTERSYGRFQRAFRLPFRPDPNGVRAEFDKGVLRITLPKPSQSEGGGRIPIQSASSGTGQIGSSGGTAAPGAGGGSSGSAGGTTP